MFHICRVWGSRHGGSFYSRALVDELVLLGWRVTLLAEEFLEPEPLMECRLLSGFFKRDIQCLPRKLRNIFTLFRLVAKEPGSVVVVQGDLPRMTYLLLQVMAPLIFIRQDAILTCPGNDRYLSGSVTVCRRKQGLGCLAIHRKEGCLGQLSRVKQLGRVIFRARDAALLNLIHEFVTSSRYVAKVHRKRARVLYPPLLVASDSIGATTRTLTKVVFCGRLERVKGPADALRILSLLPAKYHLKILGDGIERETLNRLAKKLGVNNRVEFMGWVDEATRDRVVGSAGVLLMPSLWDEAFGMSGIEALALGTPVVAYDVGGISEWCRPGTGILVPCGDTVKAAAAITKLTQNPRHWRHHSHAAQQLCDAEFPADRFGRDLRQLLKDVRQDFLLGPGWRFDPGQ